MASDNLLDIYILRESGECVYHNEYGDQDNTIKSDSTIMSSFLSAIEMFSNDVDTGADMLETANYRFVYHKKKGFIYVARTKKGTDPSMYNKGLRIIANKMDKHLPDQFDGNVTHFRRVGNMIEDEFFSKPDGIFEFSGKYARDLSGDDMKIYSYLRLKGRANLRTISQMMSMNERDAYRIANKLVEKDYLVSYS